MRITLETDDSLREPEVIIRCKEVDTNIETLVNLLSSREKAVMGKRDGESYPIPFVEILYFESVDRRTFAYTRYAVFEVDLRLYQIADGLSESGFVQISKSCVANLYGVERFKPYVGGRLMATMDNGERLIVSRTYAKDVKRRIGIERSAL